MAGPEDDQTRSSSSCAGGGGRIGIVWLAIGHYRSGLTVLVIIGVLTVPTIAGRILRRRRSGG